MPVTGTPKSQEISQPGLTMPATGTPKIGDPRFAQPVQMPELVGGAPGTPKTLPPRTFAPTQPVNMPELIGTNTGTPKVPGQTYGGKVFQPRTTFPPPPFEIGPANYVQPTTGDFAPSLGGYTPNAPLTAQQRMAVAPSLFNPGAQNILSGIGGQFPQIGHFTGQGQSLIPSAQKLSRSTGAERGLYSGYLQDQAGVVPDDIFEIANRLAPRISGIRAPRSSR